MARWTLRHCRCGWDRACALPLAVRAHLHPGAVAQQVQVAVRAAAGNLDRGGPLPTAQGGIVRHRPVQASQLLQARYHVDRLPQGQAEKELDAKAEGP